MLNLAEVRALYPEYNDMTDYELTSAMHRTHYADMPFENFAGAFGGPAEEDKAEVAARQYNALNPDNRITADDIREKDRSGLLGGARLLMEGMYDAVTDTLPDNIARIWRGGDIGPDKRGWADDVIERQRKNQYARIPSIQEVEGDTLAKSLYEGPQSVATSMATGIAGAVLGAKTGAAIGTAVNPGGGTVAGGLIGSVAGSAAMTLPAFYRLAKDQFVEEVQAAHEHKTGARLSAEQAAALNEAIDKDASEFGLWEAGPEAVAQAITSGLLFGAGGAFLKSIGLGGLGQAIGKRAITRIPAKLGVDVASEEGTEGITYIGEEGLRKEYGLRDTDPSLDEFLEEQAGPVAVGSVLQMGLVGGGKMAHDRIMRRFAEKQDNAEPVSPETQAETLLALPEGSQGTRALPPGQTIPMGTRETGFGPIPANTVQTDSQLDESRQNTGQEIARLRKEGFPDSQIADILGIPQSQFTLEEEKSWYRSQGFTDEQIAEFLDVVEQGAARQFQQNQQHMGVLGAVAQQATQTPVQQKPANSAVGYDPQLVEYYLNQGFSDEDIAEFLPNVSQGQQTAAQINSGQSVDLIAPEQAEPVGITGTVVQQPANDIDAFAEQWAAELEAQGNKDSIPANNVQSAGGVTGAVMQQEPAQQLQAQPIAQPAPMPTQSQITNTQQAPRADTQAASNALGMPAPEALPQEAQPVQPATQTVVQPSQATQQNPQDFLDSHIIVGSVPVLGGGQQAQIAASQNSQTVRDGIGQGLEAMPPVAPQTRQLPRKTHGKVRASNGSDIEVYTENGLVHIGDFETQSSEDALASAKEFVDSNISIYAEDFVKPIVDAANYLLNEGKAESAQSGLRCSPKTGQL